MEEILKNCKHTDLRSKSIDAGVYCLKKLEPCVASYVDKKNYHTKVDLQKFNNCKHREIKEDQSDPFDNFLNRLEGIKK